MHTLICFSAFPNASLALFLGEQITSTLGTDISILTVRPEIEPSLVGESVLTQAAAFLSTPPSNRIVRFGEPAEEILTELKDQNYDLVILGANEKLSPGEQLLGSVAQQVVLQDKTSVLITRGAPQKIENILIATGGLAISEPTVITGAKIASALKAKITLVYVANTVPSMYAGLGLQEHLVDLLHTDTPISRHLKDSAALFKSVDVQAQLELRHGLPAEEVLRAADKETYDLLVIGKCGHRKINRILIEEICLQIANRSPCSVLIVAKELIV